MRLKHSVIAALAAAASMLGSSAYGGSLKEIAQIPIMLDIPLNGFDIGYVDDNNDILYLTSSAHFFNPKVIHPGNNALLIVNAKTNHLIKTIHGFEHPSGVVITKSGKEAWVSDRDSTVKVVDLETDKIVDTISTGGKDRADEVAYDPVDHVFVVANGDDDPVFLTFISTEPGHKIIGKLALRQATDGLEQTVYEPKDGMFYTDVPELNKDKAKGAMLKTDPKTGKEVALIPVNGCRPHGNALGLGTDLILGCNAGNTRSKDGMTPQQAIFDTATSKVTYVVGAGGSDMSAADDRLGQYYTASVGNPDPGPVLAVIDAKSATIIQKIPTSGLAHSVAVDTNNHHVFVPEAGGEFHGCGCIKVYAPE